MDEGLIWMLLEVIYRVLIYVPESIWNYGWDTCALIREKKRRCRGKC